MLFSMDVGNGNPVSSLCFKPGLCFFSPILMCRHSCFVSLIIYHYVVSISHGGAGRICWWLVVANGCVGFVER